MIEWVDFIGFLGLGGIAFAWTYEAVRVLRQKKVEVPRNFTLLYIVASFLLTVYSVIRGDLVFIILNALATLSALLNLIVSVRYSK